MPMIPFRTAAPRGSFARATGFGARLEIEAREDAARAHAKAAAPESRLQSSASSSAEAMAWAERVGFEPRLRCWAAQAAIELRSRLGQGAVTKQAVMDRLRARRPWLFDEAA